MPLAYPAGTVAEHRACRTSAVAFDVSHLGTVRVQRPRGVRAPPALLQQRPAASPPGPGPVHAPPRRGRVRRRRHDRVVGRRRTVRRHAQRLQHDRRASAAIGGTDVTDERAVIAVQGPEARRRLARVSPEAAAVHRFARRALRMGRRHVPGGRHRLHGRGRRRVRRAVRSGDSLLGGRARARASPRPGWVRATRCASRRGFRCTATSSAPASRRSRPGWAGSWVGTRGTSPGGPPSRRSGPTDRRAACAVSWPTVVNHSATAPTCAGAASASAS